jgi:hypothetical protein
MRKVIFIAISISLFYFIYITNSQDKYCKKFEIIKEASASQTPGRWNANDPLYDNSGKCYCGGKDCSDPDCPNY